jgi:hypothetical protein
MCVVHLDRYGLGRRTEIFPETRIGFVAVQRDLDAVACQNRRASQKSDRENEFRFVRSHGCAVDSDGPHATHRRAPREEEQSDDRRHDYESDQQPVEDLRHMRQVADHGRAPESFFTKVSLLI